MLTTFISLATVLAFANLLPKEIYGTYQYILAMVDLFGIFVLAGMDTALGRSVARGMDGSWKSAISAKVRWGLVGAAASFVLGAYYVARGNMLLGSAFIIAAIAIPFWELGGIYVAYLQGKKRFDLLNIADVLGQLCVAFAVIPLLFITDNILVILAAYLASYGVVRAACFAYALRKEPPNESRDPEMVSYGKKLTLVSVMGNLATNADKIILWQFLGPASVAVYTFAQSIPLRAIGFLKIVNRLAFPKMAAQEDGVLQETLMPKIVGMVLVSIVGAILYALAAPYLFALLLPQYMEAVPYTIVVGILMVLQPFSLISSAFTAQARQWEIFTWSIGTPIARLLLFVTFIPLWGLWGAIWALVAAKTLESALLVYLFYSKKSQDFAAT